MDTVCVTVFSTAVQTLSCEIQKLLCILVQVLHHLKGIKSFCFKSSQLKVLILIHVVVEVLPYVHRNRRFIRDGSPGRPPRLSHSNVIYDPPAKCLLVGVNMLVENDSERNCTLLSVPPLMSIVVVFEHGFCGSKNP